MLAIDAVEIFRLLRTYLYNVSNGTVGRILTLKMSTKEWICAISRQIMAYTNPIQIGSIGLYAMCII